MNKRLVLILVILAGTILAADLPVREVTLYKHGVGYFERSGELKAVETVRLDFKAGDMNDVLKSLTAVDLGEGTPETLELKTKVATTALPDVSRI